MIPDHLIDKAAQAIVVGMGGKSLLADMHPEDAAYARADARAALEAVAANIWDEGWEQGMAYVTGMERGTDDDDLDHAITNPYKATERRA